jgi:hypothetical protein
MPVRERDRATHILVLEVSVHTNLLVILLEGSEILTGLGELSLLHCTPRNT